MKRKTLSGLLAVGGFLLANLGAILGIPLFVVLGGPVCLIGLFIFYKEIAKSEGKKVLT